MFSKKKTECRVCGYRFTPERENIYTAEELVKANNDNRALRRRIAKLETELRKAGARQ